MLGVAAVVVRIHQRHRGLIYPDGYQYLLMARGIVDHLRPTLQLGPGGDTFVPNFDAATKPLFPALVALVSQFGLHVRDAGTAVSVAGAALAVPCAAGLVISLGGSWLGGGVAALLVLASPAVGSWWGFMGPDGPASFFALAAAWALVARRPVLGGALAACAGMTRPEWLVIAAGAGIAALGLPATRDAARRPAVAWIGVVAVLALVLRPPLDWGYEPRMGLLAVAAVAAMLFVVGGLAMSGRQAAAAATAAGVAVTLLAAALARNHALRHVVTDEWPLAVAVVVGSILVVRRDRASAALLALVAIAGLFGLMFGVKNSESERYAANVLPILCIAAGLTVGRIHVLAGLRAAVALAGMALLTPLVAPSPERPGLDAFAAVAPSLRSLPPGPIVSSAPIAYGELLPGRTHLQMRPGVRGLIVLDGFQRLYQPQLAARGERIARVVPAFGFPDRQGFVDPGAVTVVRGVVVERGG